MIIHEIEDMEAADQNIWVPIGILEIMYDDYAGIIDKYFHSEDRDIEKLWEDLDGFPLGPETKKALKDLSNKLWKEDYQQHDDRPYTAPIKLHDPVCPKINDAPWWGTNKNNLKYKSAYTYTTVPCCHNE